MDFVDLNRKLRKMYKGLGATYDIDIERNIIDERRILPNGHFIHRVSFGSADPQVREDTVMDAIHAIAGLKDIIKGSLLKNGSNPNDYEDLINIEVPLQLVTDLDNMEKHGSQLSNQRYLETINLTNLDQVLRGQGITSVTFNTDLRTGKTSLDESSGNVKIVITGDIINVDGDVIESLQDTLEKSVNTIERFISKKQLGS